VEAGSVVVPAQGVADQHRVAARRIELAVGFDHQLETGQDAATAQGQGCVETENCGGDQTDGTRGEAVRHGHLTLERAPV
jgi:hypothetical protein